MNTFYKYFDEMPIVAILRGLPVEQSVDIAQALIDAGIRIKNLLFR